MFGNVGLRRDVRILENEEFGNYWVGISEIF